MLIPNVEMSLLICLKIIENIQNMIFHQKSVTRLPGRYRIIQGLYSEKLLCWLVSASGPCFINFIQEISLHCSLILSLFHPLPPFPVLNASVFPLINSYRTTPFLPSFHYERINRMLVNNGLLLNQAYSLCFSVVKNHTIFYSSLRFNREVWEV